MPINGDRRAIDVAKCTAFPKGTTPRLITDALNDECKAYCLLFNVPVPAEKGQIGKYLKEKFGIILYCHYRKQGIHPVLPGLWPAR